MQKEGGEEERAVDGCRNLWQKISSRRVRDSLDSRSQLNLTLKTLLVLFVFHFCARFFNSLFPMASATKASRPIVPFRRAHTNRDGIVTTSDCQLISNRGSNFIIFNYTLINNEVFFLIHSTTASLAPATDSLNWWFNGATTALTSRGPKAPRSRSLEVQKIIK